MKIKYTKNKPEINQILMHLKALSNKIKNKSKIEQKIPR